MEKRKLEKLLLAAEVVIGFLSTIIFLAAILTAGILQTHYITQALLIAFGTVAFIIGIAYALRIEQSAGYYQCAKCKHLHVPTFGMVLWAAHFGRTRYIKCPKCNQKSWQKKVLSDE